jgi:STE24 endopeptidase
MFMNLYALIILATLVIGFLLNVVADLLNLKALNPQLPADFEGVYDAEKYRQSQAYTRVQTRFGLISSAFDLVVTLVFWQLGGFQWLDEWVRGFGYGEIVTGLAYVAVLMAGQMLLSLPFNLYSTFGIEEKFGFNKTTLGVFMMDRLKGLALGVVIGAPLLALLMWFLTETGQNGWLYGWIAVTLFSLLMQYIAPTWIMPLFNKFTPIDEESPLKKSIIGYSQKVQFPLTNILVMDGSKRSAKSNAFFTGFGKNRRIALFDTLIEQHSVEELTAIVAHEVGHYKRKHIVQGTAISILHTGVLFFLMSLFLHDTRLFEAFFVTKPSVYTGLIFFSMLYSPIELILSIVMNIFSRKHEFEADRFAADTSDAGALVNGLKKLSVHNLSNLTPHPFYVFLHYSHPPVMQRIAELNRG